MVCSWVHSFNFIIFTVIVWHWRIPHAGQRTCNNLFKSQWTSKFPTETAHAQLDRVYNKIKRASPRNSQDQNSGEIRPISFWGEWRRQFQPICFHLTKVEFLFEFKLFFFYYYFVALHPGKFAAHLFQLFTHCWQLASRNLTQHIVYVWLIRSSTQI